MTVLSGNRLSLILIALCLLFTAVASHAHYLAVGGSKWCVRKSGLVARIDLNEGLLSEIKEIKEGQYGLYSRSNSQLQQIATDILQPYINKKLSVTVNSKTYPVKVDKLTRDENGFLYTIWLSVDGVDFSRPENALKIEYRLLFDETNNAHLNMAYLYKSDAAGEALQKILDNSPSEQQHNFDSASPVWEFSVKGAAAEPVTAPAIAAAPPHAVTGKGRVNSPAQVAQTRRPMPQVSALQDRPSAAASESERSPNTRGVVSPQATSLNRHSDAGENARSGSVWSNIGNFILLGIEHILTGYDHIAFLIGLIVIGLSIREVLKIITAFTVAHSITLLLAAMQIISLNSRYVESVIAVSICYIALENLFKKEVKYRWIITFCFGLIHGFGFASALQELIVGKSNLLLSVVSFNLGVETGQLMIFFVLLPVLYLLKQKVEFRRVTAGVSVAILLFGVTWLIERLFDLKLISS